MSLSYTYILGRGEHMVWWADVRKLNCNSELAWSADTGEHYWIVQIVSGEQQFTISCLLLDVELIW